ncbi:MAG TPA: ethanolamine utilization protein EutJ [Clostridiales bacterium]|jgi:branched-chain amino acid transport system substrate-binding protein|nr:ethanolamine utilization protein EutJ [Clostridiales bacterium]
MKKAITFLAVAILAMAIFGSCSQTTSKDSNTIRIGLNYELSGAAATYGQSSVEGIELAIEEINKAGGLNGKKIQTIKYDNKSEEAEATTLSTRLMTQDKVLAVLGPATSGAFKATIPVSEQNKIPVLSGSATADDVTVDKRGVKEYAFRICFMDSAQGKAMARYATENLGKQKAVIIRDSSNDYAKGLAESFAKTFKGAGGTIVKQEAYVKGDTDFNAILTSVRNQDFDVIFIPGYYEEAGLIIKQARAQGIDVPILGADGFDSPKLAELAGADALSNVYFSNHYSSLDDNPTVQEFLRAFQAKYKKEPDAFNALGYDLAKLTEQAIGHAEKQDGESIKSALAETKNFEGVTGNIRVDKNHNAVKDTVVIKLENGKQVSSERIRPEE